MSELFSRQQATRLFAFIGTGASVGAIVGPSIPVFLPTILVPRIYANSIRLNCTDYTISVWLQTLKYSDLESEEASRDSLKMSRMPLLVAIHFPGFPSL